MHLSPDLKQARIVRLNATINPIGAFEQSLYDQVGIAPVRAEAADPTELAGILEDCDAVFVISTYLPAAVIDRMRRCRVIARYGIGTDRIDVARATERGIIVANVPGFCTEEMADHALALLMSLARQLPRMSSALAAGAWRRAHTFSARNRRLANRTLGLVGFGDSAKGLARRAKACGMRLLASRRTRGVRDAIAEELGVGMVDLPELLRQSDYVSLHLPLTEQTHHLIGADAFAAMKPGACLINTSRGALVDEKALVAALASGRLAGAGLDTFETIDPFALVEGPINHPLLAFDNVVLTPHVAANSVEGGLTVVAGGIENLVSVLSGHWPRPERIVNPSVIPRIPLGLHASELELEPNLSGAP